MHRPSNGIMGRRRRMQLLLLGLVLASGGLHARAWRPAQIPNGQVFFCSTCHLSPFGGGPRNSFGEAVRARVAPGSRAEFWSPELARLDSDGDGFTNGEELGDPDGDGIPIQGATVTRPGDPSSKPPPNQPPQFTSTPVTEITAGSPYQYQAAASDPENERVTFSVVEGPSWLMVSPDGAVTGTPPDDAEGPVNVVIRAADSGLRSQSVEQSFTLNVIPLKVVKVNAGPPSLVTFPPTEATVGELYQFALQAVDPDGDAITFSKAIGPDWLMVEADGSARGVPPEDAPALSKVTLRLEDNGSPPMSKEFSFTLQVNRPKVNAPPEFVSAPVVQAEIGLRYQYQAMAVDPDSDGLVYSKRQGPDWLDVAKDGLVSGIPPEGAFGTEQVLIRVTDEGQPALSADQKYLLQVVSSFAGWQTLRFAAMDRDGIGAAGADPDQDGLSNLAEYALKLNPIEPDAPPVRLPVVGPEGNLTVEVMARMDDPRLVVEGEFSGDVAFLNSIVVEGERGPEIGATGLAAVRIRDPLPVDTIRIRFVRVRFRLAP